MGQLVDGFRTHLRLNAERLENRVLVEIRRSSHRHNKTYEMHDSFKTRGRYDPGQRAIIIDIESDAIQTITTNFGARAHEIRPKGNYPLRFKWPRNPGFPVDNLGRVSLWKVNHPGNAPSYWLTDTLKRWMDMVADEFRRAA